MYTAAVTTPRLSRDWKFGETFSAELRGLNFLPHLGPGRGWAGFGSRVASACGSSLALRRDQALVFESLNTQPHVQATGHEQTGVGGTQLMPPSERPPISISLV